MITEFIVLSFATSVFWEMFRSVVWFEISVRLAPFLIAAIAAMMTLAYDFNLIMALAATGGVAIIHRILDASGIEPIRINRKKKDKPLRGRGGKIPGL